MSTSATAFHRGSTVFLFFGSILLGIAGFFLIVIATSLPQTLSYLSGFVTLLGILGIFFLATSAIAIAVMSEALLSKRKAS